jgi:hypothetical protein
VEWYWQGKTEDLGDKPVPVPLCPPQIPYGLTRAWTRASAVRGRRLTAWDMARQIRNDHETHSRTVSAHVQHVTYLKSNFLKVNIVTTMLSESSHHATARPRIADRGDGLQIWRVATIILNKQSRTADSGWSSSFGVGVGNNPPSMFVTITSSLTWSL